VCGRLEIHETKQKRGRKMKENQEIKTVDDDIIYTTISLKPATRDRLALQKQHPRQSFDEAINEILDYLESVEPDAKRGSLND